MLKGQDILLMFIMPWGSHSQLDFVSESCASGLILTAAPTAEEPTIVWPAPHGAERGQTRAALTLFVSARAISCGSIFSAGPISMISFGPFMDTSRVLTCMTAAPDANAISGKSAAGRTTPEVPTDSMTSHCRAARLAVFHAPSGRSSPNHTTAGRKRPLHRRQRGGSSNAPSAGMLGNSSDPATNR